jgi:outer membrane protein assembly factor BamB
MAGKQLVYVGIRGTVVALDAATGDLVWQTHLKGSEFVNVVLDGPVVYATTRGEAFCLDVATGKPRWHNPLKGFGFGLAGIAISNTDSGNQTILSAEKRRRDQAAAAAASGAAAGA